MGFPLWFVVLIRRPRDGRVRSWSEEGEETPRSALPCAWSTALLSIKFVVADSVLRDQVTPAEEIHARWVIFLFRSWTEVGVTGSEHRRLLMEQTTWGRPALLHAVDRASLDSSPAGYCALLPWWWIPARHRHAVHWASPLVAGFFQFQAWLLNVAASPLRECY